MTVYEDEIDLRPYILAILQRWWFILLFALILGIAAFFYGRTRPQVYQSTATILLARSRATLNLAEQFPTVNEPVDATSRMAALMSIAGSDELIIKVIQAVGDSIPTEYREVDAIKTLVNLENQGDIIMVEATAGQPAQAAVIANAWAQQAVEAINTAYSGEQPLAEIQNQLLSSKQEYETAQSNLETFIQENNINLLEKQIAEAQMLFDHLSGDRSWQVRYYSERKQRMADLGVQAETLKLQMQSASISQAGTLGDALAVLLARADALGISYRDASQQNIQTTNNPTGSTIPSSTQNSFQDSQSGVALNVQLGDIQTITDNPANYVSDLEALIELSKEEISRSEKTLSSLEQDITAGNGIESIQGIARQISGLETQLEFEQARQRELTSQRDLTWKAYQTIAQKVTELRNATQTNNQVVLASRAIPPKAPLSSAVIRNTLVAAVLGLILGTALVLILYWLRSIDLHARPSRQSLSSDPSNQ